MFGIFDMQWQSNVKIVCNYWHSINRSIESQRLAIDDSCREQMCMSMNLYLMAITLSATSSLTCTERYVIMGLINSLALWITQKQNLLTHFIKDWLKTVGLERTKITNVLNWFPKGQGNWSNRFDPKWSGMEYTSPLWCCAWVASMARGVYVSPEKHDTGKWTEREMLNAEPGTGQEVLFLFFKRKRW